MKIFDGKKEVILVLILLAISAITHGLNMFGFPYYENDEGNYMSQAWSLMRSGEMAPYTYWYDHAPVGWIFIALWVNLTNGFFTFGPSVNSGRVFMLVIHLATSLLLYYIAKKISGKKEVGILSVLIYSFSPLGVYYQRRVLLDNMMTFWVFAAVSLVVNMNLKLSKVLVSALFFALAVLTKENAIFFLPLFLYLIYVNTHSENRKFALFGFLVTTFSLMSTYFLYAILKKEFFPVGFLGNDNEHVSLLSTFKWHMTRGADLPFWTKGSDFYGNLIEWMTKDKIIVYLGAVSLIAAMFLSVFKKSFRAPVIFGLLFCIFLIRGGLIIGFYIVPLIPIFALLIAQVYQFLIEKISFGKALIYKAGLIAGFVAIPASLLTNHNGQYTRNETDPQLKALVWIKENLSEDTYLVIDNYMFVDLKEGGFINNKVYPNADWFWKVSYDPEISIGKYGNDFRKIEYIALSHEMLRQIGEGTQDDLKKILDNSSETITWTQSTTSYLDFDGYISTNGDWMSIFNRNSLESIYLRNSWEEYKREFIRSYGQVVDTSSGNTTSEGQSYAMLRAVWIGDKETFEGVWRWTQDHMQSRSDDLLISWLWGKEGSEEKVLDPNSATDADSDIALALVFAAKRWGDNKYILDALQILRDIWDKEVIENNDKLLLIASADAERDEGYLVNPSYFSPASYKVFAQVDTTHDWRRLAGDSYYYLNLITDSLGNETALIPNWVLINDEEDILSAKQYVSGNPDDYGYDAFRTYWRLALDYQWFNSPEARSLLTKAEPFFEDQWYGRSQFSSIYTLDGSSVTSYSDKATSIGPLSIFSVTNLEVAEKVYKSEYGKFVDDPDIDLNSVGYYSQNWVWFGTALYTKRLPNFWTN